MKYQSDNSYTNAVSNLNIEFQAVNSIASAVSIKLKIPAHNPYSQESTLFDLISCSQNQEVSLFKVKIVLTPLIIVFELWARRRLFGD